MPVTLHCLVVLGIAGAMVYDILGGLNIFLPELKFGSRLGFEIEEKQASSSSYYYLSFLPQGLLD